MVSPLVEVTDRGGFAAKTPHSTTNVDPDLALFRALADRKDFAELARLCNERLLTARDGLTALRWTKDRAIVEALQDNFTGAYALLVSIHWLASTVEGRARGKYESEMGINLACLGRPSLALDRFNVAYQNARRGGDLTTCARVDTARARALVTRGETEKAGRYLMRVLNYARADNDLRLELEVLESIREFGGMR